jgi:hypothetical protein
MFKRWSKALLKLVAVLAVLFLLFLVVERVRGQISLARYKQALVAQGEKLTAGELRSAIPEGENGAPAVFEAIEQLKEGTVLPNHYPPRMKLMPSGRAVVCFRESQWVDDKKTYHWNQLAADLKANEATLAAIQAGLARPVLDNGVDHSQGMKLQFPHLGPAKSITRWIGAASQLALRNGNPREAVEPLVTGIRLPRLLAEDRLVISELVRIAIGAIAKEDTWEALQAGGWEDGDLAQLQKAWEAQEFAATMARSLEGERVFIDVSQQMVRKSNADAQDALFGLEDFGLFTGTERPRWVDFVSNLPFGEEIADFLRKEVYCRIWRFAWSHQDQRHGWASLQQLIDAARTAQRLKSFTTVRTTIQRLQEVEHGQGFYDRLRYPQGHSLTILSGSVSKALRAETDRSMTIAAIVLKRHHLRHGEYPETLDALVPEFVAAVPVDYMDGQPLRYRRNADGSFTLYSVGENLTDDGGDAALPPDRESFRNLWTRKDYVWPAPALPEEIEAYREEQRKN